VQTKRLLALLMATGLFLTACPPAEEEVPAPPPEEPAEEPVEEPVEEPAEILFDHGVTEDTIRVGLLADLTGIFAPLVVEIVEAQLVYWEMVNEAGGVAGRQVEAVVLDAGYEVPRHIEQYARMALPGPEGVVMLSLSVGSPHTSAVIADMERDNMIAVPLTWFSGWWDPDFGENVAEMYTHYCLEAMNALSFVHDHIQETRGEPTRVAVISFPGEYGGDGSAGAKLAVEALGLELVYDGEGKVVPGADQTPIISELMAAQPNLVFATVSPTIFAEIFGGAVALGLDAYWTGVNPTYSFRLAATDIGPALTERYFHSAYTVAWGEDVPGMEVLMREMVERRPDALVSDSYIIGWTYGQATHAILEHAASLGDMTRAGIKAAVQDPALVVDFGGLAPPQTWAGDDPDVFTSRESFIYRVDHTLYREATVAEGGGHTGLVLAEGPFVSEIAAEFEWFGPCFEPEA
jgi:ABC-type branched-subunit amino acid transport system substrate-binding protein